LLDDYSTDTAEVEIARNVLAKCGDLELQFSAEANALKKQVHDLIRRHDAIKYRKPPITLSVKNSSSLFGPRIVWIRYSANKFNVDGRQVRFTQEVPGRKNNRYRRSIFNVFAEPLRSMLIEIEDEAVKLRDSITGWRATIKLMSAIIEKEAKDAP